MIRTKAQHEELQIKIVRLHYGLERMLSYSPCQIDLYGRYLPAPVAIQSEVTAARGLRLPRRVVVNRFGRRVVLRG
ncbi:hypothetical protein AB0A95_30800 [Micromonospora sp. NPDC049230]|uniref:hypothetical protein n=1 Tax=Micromonospora sp. NPDC049230 TaxID=3155502 RepID=UPI0033DDD7FF